MVIKPCLKDDDDNNIINEPIDYEILYLRNCNTAFKHIENLSVSGPWHVKMVIGV